MDSCYVTNEMQSPVECRCTLRIRIEMKPSTGNESAKTVQDTRHCHRCLSPLASLNFIGKYSKNALFRELFLQ